MGWWNNMLLNKYFVDEAYNWWFVKQGKALSDWLWKTFDVGVVDGIVNGVAGLTAWLGSALRRTQTGYVRSYALMMTVGIVLVLVLVLAPFAHGGK
jgi:NADH-quinone oxidoreductase subunit L